MREQGGKSMFKKMLMTGLLAATVLSVSACGKDSGTDDGTGTVESSPAESQTIEEETEGETEDAAKSTEESEDSAEGVDNSASYIFTEMPIAAYEVTGLKVGPNETFYDEPIEEDSKIPFVELGDNTFILYCLPGGDQADENGEGDGNGISRLAAIQSPSGSSSWEAHTYTTGDYSDEYVPEGYSRFSRYEYEEYGDFTEETYGGRFSSWVDPWLNYIRFCEISHPDASQADTIYAIEIATISEADKDQEAMLSAVRAALEEGKATFNEIPVEDALARNNITVSE